MGSELESDIPTDEVTEVEEDGTEAEEDELETKEEEESEEGEEDDEDEEDSDSSDEDLVEVPWNDYSELEGAYSPSSFDGISTRPFAPEIKDKVPRFNLRSHLTLFVLVVGEGRPANGRN